MKCLLVIFTVFILILPVAMQTAKAKPASATKPSSTPKKPGVAKAPAVKPKPQPTPKKTPDETDVFEKASAIADPADKIKALRKFLADFPKTEKRPLALEMLVTAGSDEGVTFLNTGKTLEAARSFAAAVADAPTPVPESIFADKLLKSLPALFWGGERAAAFEIARKLETKCEANVGQLLSIANFYLSVENGSEARRVSEVAIKADPASDAAYMTLGLANRMDFQLDESVAAYAKALELAPNSLAARRGLAEMKRAVGRPDDAVTLYKEILSTDDSNIPARTGLILSLFDAGKKAEAEAELKLSLEANPGNVILLAGAAYWYASNQKGAEAIDYAQRAINADPRFIWSHVALARGYMSQQKPLDAERTLLAARRYGNFPTLDYEIASARVAAGFYREAAEELAAAFTVKNGRISTKLGGRIERDADNFAELIAGERRASIFAPIAADDTENSAMLKALLEFSSEVANRSSDDVLLVKAATDFTGGDDKMRVHRLLFAAKELLAARRAPALSLVLAAAAVGKDDIGLEPPTAAAAVLADELYDSRRLAATRGEYIKLPDVPRATLSTVLRGRIEELNGWANLQNGKPKDAAIRLKRAISVLPADTPFWRSSMWRLGDALEADDKAAEALEVYIKAYKAGPPDAIRYSIVETLYRKVNGNIVGLDAKIGANPAAPAPIAAVETAVQPSSLPTPTPALAEPAATPLPTNEPVIAAAEPVKTPTPVGEPTPIVEPVKPEPSPSPITNAVKENAPPKPAEPAYTETRPAPPVTAETTVSEKPAADPLNESKAEDKTVRSDTNLFPPVIITIPPPTRSKPSAEGSEKPEPKPVNEPITQETVPPSEARPRVIEPPAASPIECPISLSDESITLETNGSELAVVVGIDQDIELTDIKAVSESAEDVTVRREIIGGVKGRALFVVKSVSSRKGTYKVNFALPCGQKQLTVNVR
ncbi:MAG: hypothetical protein K1X36_06310 [Pyrinomonadaceae bacterium]|nr:hypothetical protein [Pyrinomonadaceae bacterium]